MKKIIPFVFVWMIILCLLGCGNQMPERTETIEGKWRTYYEMSDGSWECNGHIYKYRLEISGRIPNAASDETFVYLSNVKTITFEQAWKAAGLSSNLDDYFAIEEAILVE